jgi:copper chaperone
MTEFTISDMTCGHCASVIARAVREADPAARCEIDLAGRKVRIESASSAGDLAAAIAEAGYTPVVAGGTGRP